MPCFHVFQVHNHNTNSATSAIGKNFFPLSGNRVNRIFSAITDCMGTNLFIAIHLGI